MRQEYTHTPTPKLRAVFSVAELVINCFSISHLTNVGRLDNTEEISRLNASGIKDLVVTCKA